MARDPLRDLTPIERDLLLQALVISGCPRCTTTPELFDHQRRGEGSRSFERRANNAITACRTCPALERCDLKARLLSITGVVGGRYRPDRNGHRATPVDLHIAEPDELLQEELISHARAAAVEAGRWRHQNA